MTIYYENSSGERFTLYGDGLTYIDINELHTWEWSYSLSNRVTGFGGDASYFARHPRTFDLELRMRGMNKNEFIQQMNRLHDITEADIISGSPGKLYVDEQYLVCYLAVSGSKPEHLKNANFAVRTVTVLAVEPYWCTPVEIVINPLTEQQTNDNGKKFNLRYAYRYGTSISGNKIINNHYAAAPAVIQYFGPATNPSIIIAGVNYGASVTLTATDRLVIDQITHKIYTVSETGVKTSVFNKRYKAYDVFAPIPVGDNSVSFGGDYVVQVTMIQQRSELKWTA